MNYDEYIQSILTMLDVRYHYMVAVLNQVMELIHNPQGIIMELMKSNLSKEEVENMEQMEQMMRLMFMNMEDFADE